ncbi:MAG: pyridoxamine 5'-phosphate oxidase family protein [Bacteroidales bacterium]|jgi:uncharacterized pyridoxamine 5'-phosphate oxidase family protein|nr:pyridoxamine 5'-phosphate oxidase family protein [Bacteroidales bacterium]
MKKLFLIFAIIMFLSANTFAQNKNEKQIVMNEVYQFLKESGTYYLATNDGNQPRVRPFGTINIFDGKLYIQTGRKKNVAQQMISNPKIEICAMLGNKWIRIEATVIEDNRLAAKESMLNAYPSLKSMYSATDENTMVLYLTEVTASIYDFGSETKILKF